MDEKPRGIVPRSEEQNSFHVDILYAATIEED